MRFTLTKCVGTAALAMMILTGCASKAELPPQMSVAEFRAIVRRIEDEVAKVMVGQAEIVRDVVTRKLQPGTLLSSEAQMLEDYGVGRGSLREALRILEVHGLITMKPGRNGGPMVIEVGSRDYGRMSSLFFHLGGVTPYLDRSGTSERVTGKRFLPPGVASLPT